MKTRILIAAAFAAFSIGLAKADYITITVVPNGDSALILTAAKVPGNSTDTFKFIGPDGSVWITAAGVHRVPPYGPNPIGHAVYIGGGGGGGGEGKNRHMPETGEGVVVIVNEPATGAFGFFTVTVPFVSGWINVNHTTGNSYSVIGYSISIPGYTLATNGQLTVAQQLLWKRPE